MKPSGRRLGGGGTLTTLADGADLVMTGQTYGVAANVAGSTTTFRAAALHHFPMVNGQNRGPADSRRRRDLVRAMMKVSWRLARVVSDAGSRATVVTGLGPPGAGGASVAAERPKSAYDPVFFSPTGGRMELIAARLSAR